MRFLLRRVDTLEPYWICNLNWQCMQQRSYVFRCPLLLAMCVAVSGDDHVFGL